MPLYEFTCKRCGHVEEKVFPRVATGQEIECSKCKGTAVQVISRTGRPVVKGGTPMGPGRRQ